MNDKNDEIPNKVLNYEVEKRVTRAEDYLRNPQRSIQLLDEAVKKAKSKEINKGPLAEVWNTLTAFFRLLRAYTRHEYTHIPWGSIVLIAVAVIYFVSPFDLLPDWIPLAGFIDDAAVIGFVLGQVNSDLEDFLRWEKLKKSLDSAMDDESAN